MRKAYLGIGLGSVRTVIRAEGVYPKSLVGHGGLFKTPGVAEKILSDMLGIPVATRATAGEGGAWGIAKLAMY